MARRPQPASEEPAVLAPGGRPPPLVPQVSVWTWGLRPLVALALGNLLGWGAWRLGLWGLPALWAGLTPESHLLALIGLTAVSAMVMAGPPVLVGALAARLAGRAHLLVGVLSGLWSLMLMRTVPAGLPIAPGLWFASTALVLFSGGMGGWTMSFGRLNTDRAGPRAAPAEGEAT